ncbi:MAG: hypothetical protein QW273_01375, partial [Candidatus Pacearchaeota archaeon]
SFLGSLDGNNYNITNLYIGPPIYDYKGLFCASSGKIKNLGIKNITISSPSYSYIGGITGSNSGLINNSFVYGNITGYSYVGGIAGYNNGNITKCGFSGNLSSGQRYGGGIVGWMESGLIEDCFSFKTDEFGGTIGGRGSSGSAIGGLVGYLTGGKINKSYSKDMLIWTPTSVGGGLVGQILNDGSIYNSYSTSNVTVMGSYGGGLVGEVHGTYYGFISNSYSTGFVSVDGVYYGGFIGAISVNFEDRVTTSFFNNQTSGIPFACGGSAQCSGVTPLPTSEMKKISNYQNAGWKIFYTDENINDGYPFLAWQGTPFGDFIWLIYLNCTTLDCSKGCYTLKNSSGIKVAIFDNEGNLCLRGQAYQNNVGTPDGRDFIIKNSTTGNIVAWIDDSTGNLRLRGNLTKKTVSFCSPPQKSFIFKNRTSGNCVSYFDSEGNLILRGIVIENANL